MKQIIHLRKHEIGQVIPLVVLMMFAIIAMVALVIDGGSLLSNRRTAQAAADSGALAGAKELCSSGSYLTAKSVAESYALVNNASTALATVSGETVSVNAKVANSSFFAGILGINTLTSSADAAAGCYGPSGKGVLPLAWKCNAPTVGGVFDPNMGCNIQTLSWKYLLQPLIKHEVSSITIDGLDYTMDSKYSYSITRYDAVAKMKLPPKQIYIIINTDKICVEDNPVSGAIVCDLNGDGKKDIQTGGDRGWLYLTSDTNNISQWITNPPTFVVKSHIWLTGKSGVDTDVFKDIINEGYQGMVVMVPVYNYLCLGDPRSDATCMTEAHSSPWPPAPASGDLFDMKLSNGNYHILTFDPFYISCVSKKGDCPGANYAQKLNPDLKDTASIEGFFLRDVDVTPDATQQCVVNLGNCVVSLSK